MTRDPATGWVNLDDAKCIGWKMCVQACPFGNSVWDELSHKILKCDYCGGDPECANFLPTLRDRMGGRRGCDTDAQARVREHFNAAFS